MFKTALKLQIWRNCSTQFVRYCASKLDKAQMNRPKTEYFRS